jgi:hypothetical protein
MDMEKLNNRINKARSSILNTKSNCVIAHSPMDEFILYAIQTGKEEALCDVRAYIHHSMSLGEVNIDDLLDYLDEIE